MPTYTLTDLARLADVTPRTVRYYISSGLLPSPGQQGPGTRYDDSHLVLLRVIKKLQAAHLPLAEIRARLRTITDDELASIASSTDGEPAPDSAIDYIRRLMGRPALPAAPARAVSPAARVPAPARGIEPAPRVASELPEDFFGTAARYPLSGLKPEPEPQRSQWERIPLDPDIELHVRRPLTRRHNKRVERLITIARQLFEED